MIDSTVSFHKLWVVESLKSGDLKTGRILVEGPLVTAASNCPNLIVEYRTPHSKTDLLQLFDLIRDEAVNQGSYAMLHFECHGCEDGLELASGELVSWEDLREGLIAINQACHTNLVIAVAACDGAHLIKVATRLDRAPFWAIIATEGAITAGALRDDFGAFYNEFFLALDGDAAVTAINRGIADATRRYKFITAAGLFARAYRKYHKRYCTGRGMQERVEELVTQAMKQTLSKKRGVRAVRKQIKQELSKHDKHFEDLKIRFFFLDKFPENAPRYPFTRKDMLKK